MSLYKLKSKIFFVLFVLFVVKDPLRPSQIVMYAAYTTNSRHL